MIGLLPVFALLACETAEPQSAPDVAPATETAPASTPDATRALVPSPLEIEAAVIKAGISGGLASEVSDRVPSTSGDDPNATAVRAGVALSDAIFAGKDAPPEQLLARLRAIRQGMTTIGAGDGLLSQIDDQIAAIEAGSAGKQEFIQSLDDISSMMVPEEGWGPNDKTGPLLQAGAWLEGSHLIAKAVLKAQDHGAANALLHEKEVVDYFLSYVRSQGSEQTSAGVVSTLEAVLATLSEIAGKENITLEDVRVIEAQTGQVLSLL